jgi:hypothetical protein
MKHNQTNTKRVCTQTVQGLLLYSFDFRTILLFPFILSFSFLNKKEEVLNREREWKNEWRSLSIHSKVNERTKMNIMNNTVLSGLFKDSWSVTGNHDFFGCFSLLYPGFRVETTHALTGRHLNWHSLMRDKHSKDSRRLLVLMQEKRMSCFKWYCWCAAEIARVAEQQSKIMNHRNLMKLSWRWWLRRKRRLMIIMVV